MSKLRITLLCVIVCAATVASITVYAQTEPTLTVTGLVDNPYNLTVSDLEAFQGTTERATCRCVGWPPDNPGINGYDVYTYDWTGVPLASLLDKAGVKSGAVYVIVRASDGYSSGLRLEYAMDPSVIIATRADGAPLDKSTGAPFRFVVPGWWGYKWVKFVERIEVVDYVYGGTWESSGYADVAIISTPEPAQMGLSQYGLPLALIGVLVLAAGVYLSAAARRMPSP
ncbi:MAG: molybdopterin-dependent oxidoreductase [Candidatus Bathyarchaeota archaeon]|nr:molybdopterin-dependent oxidoreductase [Candidatus Bathyarchaeota archaeon]